MEEMRTMDYKRYVEFLDEHMIEVGMYENIEIAIEQATIVQENPNRMGKKDGLKTEVICIVKEQPSKWSSTYLIDGYVVVAYYE